MKAYKYIVDECWELEHASYFYSDLGEDEAKDIAAEAAEHYYPDNKSCWRENDLISIEIFKEDGTSLGVFNVEYDLVPQFRVYPEDPAQPSCPC